MGRAGFENRAGRKAGFMANFNKVILVGNLTRDPQMRYTPSGTAVCDFGVAVNRQWKSHDGENKEDVCFIDVSAWGRTGEVIAEYKKKGDQILIEGRLQMQTWQGQDGQKRTKHVVVAEAVQFLGQRREGGGSDQGQSRPPRQAQPAQGGGQQAPGGGQQAQGGGQQAPGQSGSHSDPPADSFGGDEIPF